MIHLVCGPPGSGKTAFVLTRVRQYLERRDNQFVLLVPTATFAEHLRHQLAREGFILHPHCVTTLSGFISRHARGGDEPSAATLDALLRLVLNEQTIPRFDAVRQYPGFRDRLAQLVGEFGAAGIPAGPLSEACQAAGLTSAEIQGFLRVYANLERQLQIRKLSLRGARIQSLAQEISVAGLSSVAEIFLDGFYAFSAPERQLLLGLSRHASITLTVPQGWPEAEATRAFLLTRGATEETLSASNTPAPTISLVSATSREAEAHEVARNVIDLHERGVVLREIGVVLRTEQPYGPILRSAFSRFGIPARFYFPLALERQPPARLLASVLEALLSGWDRERLLEIVRYNASGLGGTFPGDRLDHAVSLAIPGRGLEPLGDFAEAIESISDWPTIRRTPKSWATALANLTKLVYPGRIIHPLSPDDAAAWRVQAASIRAWAETIEHTAENLPVGPILLADFWQEAREAIRLTRVRDADGRRNVVQVMDVFEARQWRLPHVFVCGLLEGEFPQFAVSETFFGDGARESLRAQGIVLRTAQDRQTEEDLLLESAVHRGANVVLSWPAFDEKGEATLPSFALERFGASHRKAEPSRPRPRRSVVWPAAADHVSRELVEARLGGQKKWSASEIERFLQCPFLYFSERTLRLAEPPKSPGERFTPREHGSLVHAVLYELHRDPDRSLDDVFDRIFRDVCRRDNVKENHRVEWARLGMLRNLRAFLQSHQPTAGWKSFAEYPFEFPLVEDLIVRGRIDRFDEDADGRVIATDFKYSGSQRAKDLMKSEEAVQGGLYLLALQSAGKQPIGFRYVPLRGDSEPIETTDVAELMESARMRTIDAVSRVRQGYVAVKPADPDVCRYCSMRSICRVGQQADAAAAAGEDAEWD